MNNHIVVDVEALGAVPGMYPMTEFAAVMVTPNEDGLRKTFWSGLIKPEPFVWRDEEVLKLLNLTPDILIEREMTGKTPLEAMAAFSEWLKGLSHMGKPVFWSDNNGFDFPFINYYFHYYYGENPFGWSSRRISDLYCGMKGSLHARWKHLRQTAHTHNSVDDAMGNAEALWDILNQLKKGNTQ